MRIFRCRVLVIDSETTGLQHHHDARPWEVAGVLLNTEGEEVDHMEILGAPAIWMPRMAWVVTIGGYTADQLLKQPPLANALPRFHAWLDSLTAQGPLIVTSFNVDFDSELLSRVGLRPAWGKCIMRLACDDMGAAGVLPAWRRKSKKGKDQGKDQQQWKFPNLGEAATFYGVPREGQSHRALADARVAAGVAVALHRKKAQQRADNAK